MKIGLYSNLSRQAELIIEAQKKIAEIFQDTLDAKDGTKS